MTGRSRRSAGRRGVVAIEYGLLLPAFLLLVFGAMDTGRLLWTQTTLDRAVQAAARCGSVNTTACGSAVAIQTYAATQAWGLTVAPSAFSVSAAACGIKVSASFPFEFTTPWITTLTSTLQATACSPAGP